MDPKTITALEGSILKWDAICSGCGVDDGIENCPLCMSYYDDNCFDCPVAESVGVGCCRDTPYDLFFEESSGTTRHIHDFTEVLELAKLAEDELIFLLGLLPKDHPWRNQI